MAGAQRQRWCRRHQAATAGPAVLSHQRRGRCSAAKVVPAAPGGNGGAGSVEPSAGCRIDVGRMLSTFLLERAERTHSRLSTTVPDRCRTDAFHLPPGARRADPLPVVDDGAGSMSGAVSAGAAHFHRCRLGRPCPPAPPWPNMVPSPPAPPTSTGAALAAHARRRRRGRTWCRLRRRSCLRPAPTDSQSINASGGFRMTTVVGRRSCLRPAPTDSQSINASGGFRMTTVVGRRSCLRRCMPMGFPPDLRTTNAVRSDGPGHA